VKHSIDNRFDLRFTSPRLLQNGRWDCQELALSFALGNDLQTSIILARIEHAASIACQTPLENSEILLF